MKFEMVSLAWCESMKWVKRRGKEKGEEEGMPGFDVVFAIAGLLACFICLEAERQQEGGKKGGIEDGKRKKEI